MGIDRDGNLEFGQDPSDVYTIPDTHIFSWGIRIWRNFDDQGKPKVYWHIDGEVGSIEAAGTLETVKSDLIHQQLAQWRDTDDEIILDGGD